MGTDATTRQQARQWLEELLNSWATGQTGPDAATQDFIVRSLQHAINSDPREQLGTEAVMYLERLAHHFSGDDARFETPSQVRAFCERIRRSVNLLVAEFQELLAGRKKVQNDWALYSSTTLSGEHVLHTRDVRLGNIHGDLGQVLFDWKHPDVDPQEATGLRESLDELKHHQLATMAGYERSVVEGSRALMDSLDPASIEREFLGAAGKDRERPTFTLKRFLPLRGYFLWKSYQKRFAQIASEDALWYQRQFLPAFRSGYRDYMVSRPSLAGRHNQQNQGS